MLEKRRKYSPEFKSEAVRLVIETPRRGRRGRAPPRSCQQQVVVSERVRFADSVGSAPLWGRRIREALGQVGCVVRLMLDPT